MSRGANPGLRVGDVLLDTSTRITVQVTRLIGNNRVETKDIRPGFLPAIVESAQLVRGITSGRIHRVSAGDDLQ